MTSFESNRSIGTECALLLSIHRRRQETKPSSTNRDTSHCKVSFFSASQRSSALTHRKKVPQFALYRRRQAVEKRMLCFIKHKSKIFVSKFRDLRKEKVAKRGNTITFHKTKWPLLRISSCFVHFLPRFFQNRSSYFVIGVSHARVGTPKRTHAHASRTQRVSFLCLHPSPSHLTL